MMPKDNKMNFGRQYADDECSETEKSKNDDTSIDAESSSKKCALNF